MTVPDVPFVPENLDTSSVEHTGMLIKGIFQVLGFNTETFRIGLGWTDGRVRVNHGVTEGVIHSVSDTEGK